MATKTSTSTDIPRITLDTKPEGGRDVHSHMAFIDDSVHLDFPLVPPGAVKPDPDHAFITHPVVVKDLRGKEDQFSMDVNGFRFLKHKSALGYEDFHDRAKHSTYTKEIEELLKKETGASRMVLMGHMVRAGPWNPKGFNTGPSLYVHCDATMDRTIDLLKSVCGAESEELLKKRWAQVNIWRPIKTIKKAPFALMDYSSLREEDMKKRGYKHVAGSEYNSTKKPTTSETVYPVWNPDQRWYYQSFMQPYEAMIFTIAASDHSKAWFVPHSAFTDPEFESEDDRESIETRVFIFWD